MKLTEKELRERISQALNEILTEAPQQNGGPDVQGNFNQDYIDKNMKKRGLTGPNQAGQQTPSGRYKAAKAGKAIAGAGAMRGGTILGAAAMGVLAGIGGAALTAGNVLNIVGVGVLAVKYFNSIRSLNRVSKLEFPKNPQDAMKYARYAAAERVNAQQICQNVQQNLKNAINAWNQAFPSDRLDWPTLVNYIRTQEGDGQEKAQFQDRGETQQVDADFNMNFTDKNAGKNEGKNGKNLVEAQGNYEKEVKSVGEYKILFQGDKDGGEKELIGLAQVYIQSYGLWMQWTRYINVLVHNYQKWGVTWERVINANNDFGVKNTLITFANELFKTNIPLDDPDKKDEYRGNSQTQKIILRVVAPKWYYGAASQKNKKSYILFQQEKTNHYFAVEPYEYMLPNQTTGTFGSNPSNVHINATQNGDGTITLSTIGNNQQRAQVMGTCPELETLDVGDGLNFNYSPNMISNSVTGSKGEKIYILRQNSVFNMRKFSDDINQQQP